MACTYACTYASAGGHALIDRAVGQSHPVSHALEAAEDEHRDGVPKVYLVTGGVDAELGDRRRRPVNEKAKNSA